MMFNLISRNKIATLSNLNHAHAFAQLMTARVVMTTVITASDRLETGLLRILLWSREQRRALKFFARTSMLPPL